MKEEEKKTQSKGPVSLGFSYEISHTCNNHIFYYTYCYRKSVRDFRISDLDKNPDGINI